MRRTGVRGNVMKQSKTIFLSSIVLLSGLFSCAYYNCEIYSHPFLCDSEKGEWVKSSSIGPGSFHIGSIHIQSLDDLNIASGYIIDLSTQKALSDVDIFLLKSDTCKCKLTGPIGKTDYLGIFRVKLKKENCTKLFFYHPEMVSQEIRILNCP